MTSLHKTETVPTVSVGILSEPSVTFVLHGTFLATDGASYTGEQTITTDGQMLRWQRNDGTITTVHDLLLSPLNADDNSFTVRQVTIGVSFHWRRQEDQTFRGAVRLLTDGGKVVLINILPVEDYLLSVISSEMSANASLELLKAHAVISRSWLLAQIEHASTTESDVDDILRLEPTSDDEDIRWWDHSDHHLFDVCADDHCQRYQGISRVATEKVRQAVEGTRGQVLTYAGELCDARFSKSCGGVLEEFENCWEPEHHHYLEARRDGPDENDFPDLSREAAAEEWILSSPKAFCNTADPDILSQVLNDYDRETRDFYRWHVEYSQAELSALIARRTGVDYGRIRDLQPVARGRSGRLYKMRIVGEHCRRVIGKELAIRYALSPSCLYSSAFVVERRDLDSEGYPAKFVLHGAGWGHGVGLCQIGAAVMGAKGYDYQQILLHYFVDATIEKKY